MGFSVYSQSRRSRKARFKTWRFLVFVDVREIGVRERTLISALAVTNTGNLVAIDRMTLFVCRV